MNTYKQNSSDNFDVVCLSHLRWDFVYQRPQHLMSRYATRSRVYYFEEPVWDAKTPVLQSSVRPSGVTVVVPHVPESAKPELENIMKAFVDNFLLDQGIKRYCLWYYTPMAVAWTKHLQPLSTVYDCMDELSAFRGAPPELPERESELLKRADVVFTGGYSLYEKKRHLHGNIYPFPSSIDIQHFARARGKLTNPADQGSIPHKRIGFAGVIDERMDLNFLASSADLRPEWHFIMLGPVAKIDSQQLPRRANIHYLGMKAYDDLPPYFANWDAAILPFAKNDSTKYISPTKVPEYLAAGLPVVSTSIEDVVRPYGALALVKIADDPESFVSSIEKAMNEDAEERIRKVDALLAQNSWSRTWRRMSELIEDAIYTTTELKMPLSCAPAVQRALTARFQ